MPLLAAGVEAPDFTLPDQHGSPVTLTRFRGVSSVVVMFYPFAFTPVCTAELGELRDMADRFRDVGAAVHCISCDSIYTLKVFAEQAGLADQTLLSDFWPHGEVSRRYGAFLPDKGVATRATYVVDRQGVVRWSTVTGLGQPRNPADYLEALAAVR